MYIPSKTVDYIIVSTLHINELLESQDQLK